MIERIQANEHLHLSKYIHRQEGSTAFTPLKPYEQAPHRQNRLEANTGHDKNQELPTRTEHKLPVI